MPYLGGIPVVDVEPTGPVLNGFEDSRTLAFRSIDGADLISFTGDEFIVRRQATGLDLAPRDVVEVTYAGEDGGQLDDITVGSRVWGLPLRVGAMSGHRAFLDNRAALRRLLNHRRVDYRAHGGTFDLVASSVIGERSLRSAYVSGWEGADEQATSGSYFETLPLVCKSVRPYWTGPRWSTPKIQKPPAAPWFGTFPPVFTPSRTLGQDIGVTVEGDASGYCRVEVAGYAPSVLVTGPGLRVSIPQGVAAGESCVVETYPPQAGVYFNGLVDWSRVAPSRQFAAIDPGEAVFNVDLGNSSPDAYAVISGPTLWDAPW